MKDLAVSLEKFGLYQGTMAAAFSVVNFGSAYLLNKFGQKKCFYFSIFILIIFVFANIVLIFVETKNPLLITLVTVLAAIGMVIPCNILWPLSLEAAPQSKSRITALFVQLIGYLYRGTSKELGIVMCVTLIITLVACYKLLQEDIIFG